MTQKREFNARTERIEALVKKLEESSDPELHATAMELLQSVMELHGAALDRMLQILSENAHCDLAAGKFLQDDLVASLLLLHNLHPDDLETRVHRALDKVRPQLAAQAAEAELVAISDDGVVRLRLHKSGGGCASTANTLKGILEDAVADAAPDAAQIIAETVQETPAAQLITIR